MGCGKKAAAMEEEEQAFDQRMKRLQTVSASTWDTFLDDVDRLIESIEKGSIMSIAHATTIVKDGHKYIRGLGR